MIQAKLYSKVRHTAIQNPPSSTLKTFIVPKRLGDEAVPHVFAVDLSNVCSSVVACRGTSDMWMVMWFFSTAKIID